MIHEENVRILITLFYLQKYLITRNAALFLVGHQIFIVTFLLALQSQSGYHLAKFSCSYILPLHVWIWLLLLLRYNLSHWSLICQLFSILYWWSHLLHSVWVHLFQHLHSFLLQGSHVFRIVDFPDLKKVSLIKWKIYLYPSYKYFYFYHTNFSENQYATYRHHWEWLSPLCRFFLAWHSHYLRLGSMLIWQKILHLVPIDCHPQ